MERFFFPILTVTPADVRAVGQTQQVLAEGYGQQIIAVLQEDQARFFRGDPKTSLVFIAVARTIWALLRTQCQGLAKIEKYSRSFAQIFES